MLKLILGLLTIFAFLIMTGCSTVKEVRHKTSAMSNGANDIDSSASDVDRTIATGERLKARFKRKK